MSTPFGLLLATARVILPLTPGSQTALFEDGEVRPSEPNRALTRTRDSARDSETLKSKGRLLAGGRVVAGRATGWERDCGTAERA